MDQYHEYIYGFEFNLNKSINNFSFKVSSMSPWNRHSFDHDLDNFISQIPKNIKVITCIYIIIKDFFC